MNSNNSEAPITILDNPELYEQPTTPRRISDEEIESICEAAVMYNCPGYANVIRQLQNDLAEARNRARLYRFIITEFQKLSKEGSYNFELSIGTEPYEWETKLTPKDGGGK